MTIDEHLTGSGSSMSVNLTLDISYGVFATHDRNVESLLAPMSDHCEHMFVIRCTRHW